MADIPPPPPKPEAVPPTHPLSLRSAFWCCEHMKKDEFITAEVLYKGDSLCKDCFKKSK